MNGWLFVAFALISQELVAINAVIFKTYNGHYNVILIHLLFIVATLLDIWTGFYVGKFVQKKYPNGKLTRFTKKWIDKFQNYIGKKGKRLAILILGAFGFPYVNAFIVSWLNVSFREATVILTIGNMISYTLLWLIVLGITSLIPNPLIAFAAIIGVSIIIIGINRKFKI